MKLVRKEDGLIVADRLEIAAYFWQRALGLMFQKELKFGGLMITPCQSIHTFFMRFPIDVIFINRQGVVVKVIRDMRPWRVSLWYLKAASVIELKGSSLELSVKKGDILEVIRV